MIKYRIENAKSGALEGVSISYEQALIIQDKKLKEENIDTYIIKI